MDNKEENILNYETIVKELEKLENEKIALYKDLNDPTLSEENKKFIHEKIHKQNEKISSETQKGILAVRELEKSNLSSSQKNRVEQIGKKNKPESRSLFDIFESYPQLIKDFPEIDFEDVKKMDNILQLSSKKDWSEARKIVEQLVKKRKEEEEREEILANENVKDKEDSENKLELDSSKELNVPIEEPNKESIKISNENSFINTLKPINLFKEQKLNSNTCTTILTAPETINSKFAYPSQFPNLTKIKSFELQTNIKAESNKSEVTIDKKSKILEEDIKQENVRKLEDVKKGGKKKKSRSKKLKRKVKNRSCKSVKT